MPSLQHEVTIEFFRNRPQLARQLLCSNSQMDLPEYEARFDSADLSQVQPTEYRADGVVTLTCPTDGSTAVSIVVEIQRQVEERKRYTWPAYLTTLRARLECPVFLLVLSYDEATATWCAQPIDLGAGTILPRVVGPAEVPWITDVQDAEANPELAVLSVMAHGHDPDFRRATAVASVARQAIIDLDDDKAVLYLDLILASLGEAARQELPAMIPAGYEFQSEFVRTHFNKALQEGLAKGRIQIVLKLLTARYGALPPSIKTRINNASTTQLEDIAERLLTAPTLEEALGTP